MRQELKKYYREIGLDENEGRNCPSYLKCAKSCEQGDRGIFIPPIGAYVGERYSDLRVLFAGINTRQDKKQRFDAPYRCKWFDNLKDANGQDIDGALNNITRKLARLKSIEGVDPQHLIAFTNAVKCSVTKNAGAPTNVMRVNCINECGYLFKEVEILKPKLIIAFGAMPFTALRNAYKESITVIKKQFEDRTFYIENQTLKSVVLKLNNPRNGYQGLRKIYKKIKEGKEAMIGDQWTRFLPENVEGENNLAQALEDKYRKEKRIDKANPFYDAMFDKLIEIASQKIPWLGG
jgi:hypothetical protein